LLFSWKSAMLPPTKTRFHVSKQSRQKRILLQRFPKVTRDTERADPVRGCEGSWSSIHIHYVMNTKLFVGGIPFNSTEQELHELFAGVGEVASVRIITDRVTGRSRGFGFVEMATAADAEKAIQELDGAQFGGRSIAVSEARPKQNEM